MGLLTHIDQAEQAVSPVVPVREMRSEQAPADSLAQRGRELLAAGKPAEAVRAFRAAIAADSNHVEAHYAMVRALREAGRLEASIAAALALTVLTPQSPQAHSALALSLRTAGHIHEAETAARRARLLEWKEQLEPRHPEKLHSVAQAGQSSKPELPS